MMKILAIALVCSGGFLLLGVLLWGLLRTLDVILDFLERLFGW